jgi:hypothetical protein
MRVVGDQGQPQAAPPAFQPQGPAQTQPQPQAQPGATGHAVPGKDFEKETYDTPEEVANRNRQLKEMHLDNVKVAVLKSDMSEQDAKVAKAKIDKTVNEARLAETQEYRGQAEDAIREHGLQDKIGFEFVPKGTRTKSSRIGGRLGRIFGGMGITAGSTSGQSGEVFPEVAMTAVKESGPYSGYGAIGQKLMGGANPFEDRDPNLPNQVADAFVAKQKEGGTITAPIWLGVQDMIRDRAQDLGKYANTKEPITVGPFSAVLEPEKHQAASAAASLKAADQKVIANSPAPLQPVGLPEVKDAPTSIADTIGLFGKAVDQKISGFMRNLRPSSAEGPTISELATRMKPDQPDGTYSPEAVQAAKEEMAKLKDASVSDVFKNDAMKILAPIANQPVTKPAGKTTSEAEPQQGTPSGVPGMRGQLTMAALGGLSDFGAQKAAQQTAPQDVADANKAWGTIGPNSKDKETLAKTAVSDVSSAYGRMTQTEQTQAQSTWKAKRKIWKDQYKIPVATLKDMNEAVGLDRDDGL